ncbi:RHS repeat-associated core domain-containing protein, partial [Cyanothece sp. BG0011]|uniref:RHS repeat-associated core domain-containing protein n=1 Tax=Cyanothece sp. BG0011 TaxID=2082950 RepID=UPI0018E4F227
MVSDSSGNVITESEYIYDVYDRRIAKFVDEDGDGVATGRVERFVLDDNHIALTFDGFGNLRERFLHGTETDQVIAIENAGGEVNWALTDNQGSIRLVLDSEGNIINNITYDSFGNITLESDSSVEFRFGYTGREFDDETGLDYYGARYRDASVGRFISEDPLGFQAGDFNLYRYTFNSPTNYTDPSGYTPLALAAV